MRILIVSQYYPPEAVPIPAELARGLAERGHSVRVLTGFPNYPQGRVFEGYRQRWRHRERDGEVAVYRVPLLADHSQRALRRMANYVSFALTSATARRYARGADVIYVYATQMTAAFGPWLWRLTGGAPYILHVQDLWPDSVIGSSMGSSSVAVRWMSGTLSRWLRSVYRTAAYVVGIAPTMVSTLLERGAPAGRTSLVYNWAHKPGASTTVVESSSRSTRRINIVYAGNVGEMQDLETAVQAAHIAADAGVHLTVVGDGVARAGLRKLVDELGCTNVWFEDPVPRESMWQVYARADFGLVVLKDLPVFRGTIPSKFQAVLAHGLPVITSVQGDVRRLVEELDVGLTADAGDVGSLESAFRLAATLEPSAQSELRARAEAAFEHHFDRASAVSKIEAILQKAAQAKGKE